MSVKEWALFGRASRATQTIGGYLHKCDGRRYWPCPCNNLDRAYAYIELFNGNIRCLEYMEFIDFCRYHNILKSHEDIDWDE